MKFFNVIAIKAGIQVYSILNMCTGIIATHSASNQEVIKWNCVEMRCHELEHRTRWVSLQL